MKRFMKFMVLTSALFVFAIIFSTNANAQLLINEIEADPGNQQNDSCQYIELRGTPGSTVAANTWFLAIESDSLNPGFTHVAVNLGGQVVGANGTLTLVNDFFGAEPCPNRTYPAGTNVVLYNRPLVIGGPNVNVGSESFVILETTTVLSTGQDRDLDDDGVLDFPVVQYIDAVVFLINPDEQFPYPSTAPVIGTPFADVPDALVRFPGNNTPFSGSAYYWAEVAGVPDEAVELVAPLSPNFPVGGILTPGSPNVPAAPGKATVDFNGDGRTDYSVTRTSGGQQTWYNSLNGSGQTAFAQFGIAGDIPVPEDYDGDGKDDIAIWRPDAPSAAAFWILRSSDNTVRVDQFGQTGDNPAVVGDWDGDGKADPAVYRNAAFGSQSFFFYLGSMNNPNNNITYVPWGSEMDRAVRGDFDADNRPDAAIYRPTDQTWWIRQSSNGQLATFVFGLATDIKVSGDFDGDGRTDPAVFRDGTWIILQSTNSQVRFVQWGLVGDIPVSGDYDGDGSTDFAIWRSGTFYVLASTGGAVTYFQWGLTGDLPVASVFSN